MFFKFFLSLTLVFVLRTPCFCSLSSSSDLIYDTNKKYIHCTFKTFSPEHDIRQNLNMQDDKCPILFPSFLSKMMMSYEAASHLIETDVWAVCQIFPKLKDKYPSLYENFISAAFPQKDHPNDYDQILIWMKGPGLDRLRKKISLDDPLQNL